MKEKCKKWELSLYVTIVFYNSRLHHTTKGIRVETTWKLLKREKLCFILCVVHHYTTYKPVVLYVSIKNASVSDAGKILITLNPWHVVVDFCKLSIIVDVVIHKKCKEWCMHDWVMVVAMCQLDPLAGPGAVKLSVHMNFSYSGFLKSSLCQGSKILKLEIWNPGHSGDNGLVVRALATAQ